MYMITRVKLRVLSFTPKNKIKNIFAKYIIYIIS